MFALISVTRLELDICESFYETREEAVNAMADDIILMTEYRSLEEIVEDANRGLCGFSDFDAWAETREFDTGQWKIVEIPEQAKAETSQ